VLAAQSCRQLCVLLAAASSTYSLHLHAPRDGMQTQSNNQSYFVTYCKYPTVCRCISEAVAVHPRGSACSVGAQTHSTAAAPARAGTFVPRAFQPQCSFMYATPEPSRQVFSHTAALCMQRRCSRPAIAHRLTDTLQKAPSLFKSSLQIEPHLTTSRELFWLQ